jgi:hypothetical protein
VYASPHRINYQEGKVPALISVAYAALLVCGASVLAVLGLVLVQRLVPWRRRQELNDVAGYLYAVVGVVYAVLLALVVIAAWENRQVARETTEREANALAEIFWLAQGLPETEGQQLQQLARSYAQTVVDEEWPLMQHGGSDPRAWALLDEIRGSLQGWQPTTEDEQELYSEGLDRVHDLADARRLRLVESQERIPAILWALVVFAGIITVVFTYIFGLENARAHRVMVMALAAVIGLAVITIGILETPFSGSAQLGPDAFELTLDRFETSEMSMLGDT